MCCNPLSLRSTLFLTCAALVWLSLPATSAGTADRSGYVADKSFLSLDGSGCGFTLSAAGGEYYSNVVEERPGGQGLVKKHLQSLQCSPFTIEVSSGMIGSFPQWLSDFFDRRTVRKNGQVICLNYDYTAKSATEFQNAVITEVTLPALDASSKDLAKIELTFQPEALRDVVPQAPDPGQFSIPSKKWLPSYFRVEIDGIDASAVNKVDAITVQQIFAKQNVAARDTQTPGITVYPNLRVTFPEARAATWQQWFKDFVVAGHNDDSKEKSGRILFLTPDLSSAIATLELYNVGICKLERTPVEPGSEGIRRMTAELYVERMAFKYGRDADTRGGSSPSGGTVVSPNPKTRSIVPSGTKG